MTDPPFPQGVKLSIGMSKVRYLSSSQLMKRSRRPSVSRFLPSSSIPSIKIGSIRESSEFFLHGRRQD